MKVSLKINGIVFIASVVFVLSALGSNDPGLESKVKGWMQDGGGLRFLENKGQMVDLEGKAVNDLLFKSIAGTADLYITTWGLSYVFTKTEQNIVPALRSSTNLSGFGSHENESTTTQYCRADMELVGADIKKENIIKEYESEDRTDYYLPQCPDGLMNVHSYERITIKNIYPGIDWVLYSLKVGKLESQKRNEEGLKYDFVVHPGADPSLIKLRYKWTDKPSLQKDGSLKVSTPMGDITEGTPLSYQQDQELKINTRYTVKDNEISFSLDKYYEEEILIIDPSLIWATYYGGTDTEEINSISADGQNVWVTGYSASSGFPTSPNGVAYFEGSFQGSNNDVILLEFNTCGARIWATYYGGNGADQGLSINSDGTNVWVTGITSSTNFPTKSIVGLGVYNQSTGGGTAPVVFTAFILEFGASTGQLIWATYYGGSISDQGNSISSDGTNVWVTGGTGSTDFPTQAIVGVGVYNQSALGGISSFGHNVVNAFILQFNCVTNARIWATYYGGSVSDDGSSISSDGKNVWVTGGTSSTDCPIFAHAGAYNQVSKGSAGTLGNAFILQFSCINSARIWATYYGGSGDDGGNSISSDGTNVWVTGQTKSVNFPTSSLLIPGAYNQTVNGGGLYDAFILQFSCSNSARVWATYYGGNGDDRGTSINSHGKNVWVCGRTSSSDFSTMKPTCGNFLGTFGSGGQDVFILQFDALTSVRAWATYYGNDTESDGSFISSDGINVYVTGDAQKSVSTSYPLVTPLGAGAYSQSTIGGITGTENAIMAKFSILCSTLAVSPDASVCLGGSVPLTVSGSNTYVWSPGTGLNTTTGSSVIASPPGTTTYRVTGTDNCGVTLTATVTVTISAGITATASQNASSACSMSTGSVMVIATGGTGIYNYSWNMGSTSSITGGLGAGSYMVTVTDSQGCIQTSVAAVSNTPAPTLTMSSTSLLCYLQDILILLGIITYPWDLAIPFTRIYISTDGHTFLSTAVLILSVKNLSAIVWA